MSKMKIKNILPIVLTTLFYLGLVFIMRGDKSLIYAILIIFTTLLSYPLTFYNQNVLHKLLRKPFVKIINSLNKIFKTKIKSAMLLFIREDLVPYVDYGYRNGVYIGVHTNALVVGDYLIKYLEENNENGIKNTYEWLLNNYEDNGNYIVWKANYERPDLGLKPGWVSGLYQGRALKALCMLWERTQNRKLLDTINKGVNAFEVDIEDGGFKSNGKHGYWFEEYPGSGEQPFVLNGFVESLLDLHYVYEKMKIGKAKYLFDKGLKELHARVREFDTGSWTYYDLLKHPARFDYHQTHIREMMDMFRITGDKTFWELANKWSKYKKADWRFYIINTSILNTVVLMLYFVLIISQKT